MADDLTIRRAEVGDADGLSRCFEAAYAEYAARISDLPPMAENCAEEIADHLVWVAEADGMIIGGLVLIPGDGVMTLANVAVHPTGRGTGIGRRLMAIAETEAKDRGYDQMRLNTHAEMPENVALYARNGWAEVGRQGKTVTMTKEVSR